MSGSWRIALAVVLGDILFLVPSLGIAEWGQSTRSWLLTNLVGDGVARAVGSLLWLVAILVLHWSASLVSGP